MSSFIPNVTANIDGKDISLDMISYQLIKNRRIFMFGEVNNSLALSIISQLIYLDEKSNDDIYLVMKGPGGSIADGMAIFDTMNMIKSNVNTIAVGECASMNAFLLSSGKKRYITFNADVMIHQPLGSFQGQASDIVIQAEHIEYLKKKMMNLMATQCKKNVKQIINDIERDKWMSAEEACKYGLVDKVILNLNEIGDEYD